LRRTSGTSKLGPIGKQFPFLWNLSGKLVHKALGGQVIRASEVQAAFWPEGRLRWPCARESKIHSDVPRESVFIAADDFPVPELREHPGMTPRSGRIGARAGLNSNRRLRVSGLDEAAVGVCLCCQVGRFGFASDSPQRRTALNRFNSVPMGAGWCAIARRRTSL
jgi:hypothetical protein